MISYNLDNIKNLKLYALQKSVKKIIKSITDRKKNLWNNQVTRLLSRTYKYILQMNNKKLSQILERESTGFELSALHLLGRHSITWVTPPALFALVTFQVGSHILLRVSLRFQSSYLGLLYIWDERHVHHAWLVLRWGGLTNFLSRLTLNPNIHDLCLPR
jgi:hypothetical protein